MPAELRHIVIRSTEPNAAATFAARILDAAAIPLGDTGARVATATGAELRLAGRASRLPA